MQEVQDENSLTISADILYGFYTRFTVKIGSYALFQFKLIIIENNTASGLKLLIAKDIS